MNNQITKGAQPTYSELTMAWNNTYGKGINPEAVPYLLNALNGVLNNIDDNGNVKLDRTGKVLAEIKSAIEKATIQ